MSQCKTAIFSVLQTASFGSGVLARTGLSGIETVVGLPLPATLIAHKDTSAREDALVEAGIKAVEAGIARPDLTSWAEAGLAVKDLGAAVKSVFDALKALGTHCIEVIENNTELDAARKDALTAEFGNLRRRFIETALVDTLQLEATQVHLALYILGVIDYSRRDDPELPYYIDSRSFDMDAAKALFTDPLAQLGAPFQWGTDAFDPAPVLRLIAGLRGEHAMADYVEAPNGDASLDLGLVKIARNSDISPNAPGVTVSYATLFGFDADRTTFLSPDWMIVRQADANLDGALDLHVIPPLELSIDSAASVTGTLTFTLQRTDQAGPMPIFGSPEDAFSLQIESPRVFAGIASEAGSGAGGGVAVSPVAGFTLEDITLRIGAGEGDGFVSKVLSGVALEPRFTVKGHWTSKDGLALSAGGGLSVAIPLGLDIGPVALKTLTLDAVFGDAALLRVDAGLEVGAALGPVDVVVEGVGARFTLDQAEGAGGFPVTADVGFKPPTGVGLSVDAGPVSGGGYLSFDHARGRYAGAIALEIGEIGVSAVGLLTTKLPSGEKGFSLVLLVSSDFPAIPLGFGFTLDALGGLLGINRTSDPDFLRAGLKNQTLDNIMFPKDPVARAPEILRAVEGAFPMREGQHVFGPMARIGWGTPQIIAAELGLVLELDSPLRLILLGKLRMGLPSVAIDTKIADVKMDVLGIIDFGRKEASLDAILYDSRIALFTLEGGMALRIRWGDAPFFALAIGGVHPAFDAPPELPQLDRIAISLGAGDNPRLRLEAFLALTSNTVQFGAKLDAQASAMGFTAKGWLGFDALLVLDPFSFQVNMFAGVALLRGDSRLMTIDLRLSLTGPSPYVASGTATVELFFIDVSVPFNARFGREERVPLPAGDPAGALITALSEPGNWSAELPEGGTKLVRLRSGVAFGGAIHPLGQLGLRQTIVPLGTTIDTFGAQSPGADRHFAITDVDVTLGQRAMTLDASGLAQTEEYFAPAQFFAMSEDEKLAAPSFEKMQAGLKGFGSAAWSGPVHAPGATVQHTSLRPTGRKTVYVDGQRDEDPAQLPDEALLDAAAAYAAPLAGARRKPGFDLAETRYALASTQTLTELGATGNAGFADIPELREDAAHTHAGARAALRAHLRRHPQDEGRIQIVTRHELEAA